MTEHSIKNSVRLPQAGSGLETTHFLMEHSIKKSVRLPEATKHCAEHECECERVRRAATGGDADGETQGKEKALRLDSHLSQWFRTRVFEFQTVKVQFVSLSPPELTKDCAQYTKFIIRQDFHCGSHHQFMALGHSHFDNWQHLLVEKQAYL